VVVDADAVAIAVAVDAAYAFEGNTKGNTKEKNT